MMFFHAHIKECDPVCVLDQYNAERLALWVWTQAESDPEFVKAMEEGVAQIAAGQTIPFREVR